MFEWLIANWERVVTIVSLVFGAVGVYLTVRSWKRKNPTYLLRSNNIFCGLEHAIPKVEVKFAGYGSPIKALTVTKIAFWNAGTETINKQDVVKDNPPALRASAGIVILAVDIVARTKAYNRVECTVNRERTEATITFDYLDHNEGALFQVFHSGTGNEDIRLDGTIRGAAPMKRRSLETSPPKRQLSRWLAIPALLVIWACLALLGLMMMCQPQFLLRPGAFNLLDIITIGLLAFFGLFMSAIIAYGLYVTTVPKTLSKIYWDENKERHALNG